MIAAIYARKSTDQGGVADEERSVARQVESARAYAEAKGWTVDDAHVPMRDADAAVVDRLVADVLSPDLLTRAVRRASELARQSAVADAARRPQIERELRECKKKLERLTEAVASGGGDVPALVDALRREEDRRGQLEDRLGAVDKPRRVESATLDARLAEVAGHWREALRGQPSWLVRWWRSSWPRSCASTAATRGSGSALAAPSRSWCQAQYTVWCPQSDATPRTATRGRSTWTCSCRSRLRRRLGWARP